MFFNSKIMSLFYNIKKFFNFLVIFLLLTTLSSCGGIPEFAKPSKSGRDATINAKERARQNVEEGRGMSIRGAFNKNKSTNYEFSTSNPLWRASLELIDFIPLSTVDYSGGIIITDWYSDSSSSNESIKITIRFLSNEIQSNSLKIIVHNKKCKTIENCNINEIDSKIKQELRSSILTKAARLELDSKNKKKK